jgi:hypothetical protein
MKLVLAILAAVLLLAGCGHASTPKDPFVGTWRLTTVQRQPGSSPGLRLVISKPGGTYPPHSYRIAMGHDGGADFETFVRHGNQLVSAGSTKPSDGDVVAYDPATGHLLQSQGTHRDIFEWVRASDSTALPIP